MVRLSTLLEQEDLSKQISELPFDAPFSVSEDGHLYDAIQLVVEHGADLLPVVSADGLYVGSIGLANVLGPVSRLLATPHRGAVVEIEAPDNDFPLRHLVHAVEETGARILSLGTIPPQDGSDPFVIVLKLSIEDTSRVRAVLEHTGFSVRRMTGHEMGDQELRQRVAEFMHYLDV
jgi:CBS domain-containing protein